MTVPCLNDCVELGVGPARAELAQECPPVLWRESINVAVEIAAEGDQVEQRGAAGDQAKRLSAGSSEENKEVPQIAPGELPEAITLLVLKYLETIENEKVSPGRNDSG
jgi:hypothetical protein